jgi:uncharacterized repeat protein (TIGR01451 family)
MKKSLLLILVVTIYSQVSAQKPVADFYTDTNIACIGTCINFTDSSTNNPLSWLWDFGDGTTDTVSNPTHCYSITGKFIVTLTVSNDSGTTSKSDTIYMGGASFNVNTVNVACNGGCNGSASVNYANWPPVVSFMWSNGNTGSSINNLCAASYSVSATDSLGCNTMNNNIVVVQPSPIQITFSKTDNLCSGNCSGSISATVSGGTSPYMYQWNNSSTLTWVTGLCNGNYSLTVTDSNGCTSIDSASIVSPSSINVTFNKNDATCGQCNGNATAVVSGGLSPYNFSWSGYQTSQSASGLCPGNYSVTVTDKNNCQAADTVNILGLNNTISLILNNNNTSCGACNGTASVSVSGGTSPYYFQWDISAGSQTTATAIWLCGGNYTVTVTDSTGCSKDTVAIINTLNGLSVIENHSDVSCYGGQDGYINLTATGGTSPYVYNWNIGSANASVSGLSVGTYTCTITDSSSCMVIKNIVITQPDSIILSVNIVNAGCNNNKGKITVLASGGGGNYQYSIDSGLTWSYNNIFQNLDTGNYQIMVMDSNSCFAYANSNINTTASSLVLNGTVYNDDGCYYNYGKIILNATGSNPPFTYQWISPNLGWGQVKNYLSSGAYIAVVKDNAGCSVIDTFIVANACSKALISGKIILDNDSNCVLNTGDTLLSTWQVKAVVNNIPYYSSSNYLGEYKLWVPMGNAAVSMVTKPFYKQVCPSGTGNYNLSLNAYDTISNINFGSIISSYCPNLIVSVFSGNLRPCFSSMYAVSVLNNGTIPGVNATVDIKLDIGISYVSFINPSGVSLVSQNGNTLTFSLGTINPGQTKSFYIDVFVDCAVPLGVTKCIEAHAYPDTGCFPPSALWDKSHIGIEGYCMNNDSACFKIKNTGIGNMSSNREFRIYENNIKVYSNTFLLNAGDSIIFCWPGKQNTIRVEADQHPEHPGDSRPQAFVERCGFPSFVLGQITTIQQDDRDDFIDIACRITTASYDPNDKQVQPEGLTSQYHFIDSTDILEYQIRFQNTGSDTAFNVYIYDTISPYLDITTFESGASSHPYTYELAGPGIIRFNFLQILLPDSNIDEPNSHGFVKFTIKQMEGNNKGILIQNTAGIVFDFNEPVITNTVFNTIGNIDSITSSAPILYEKNISAKVYPNPFNNETTFEVYGNINNTITLEVFDLLGNRVAEMNCNKGNRFVFNRNNIAVGIYIYKLTSEQNIIAAGKLVIE